MIKEVILISLILISPLVSAQFSFDHESNFVEYQAQHLENQNTPVQNLNKILASQVITYQTGMHSLNGTLVADYGSSPLYKFASRDIFTLTTHSETLNTGFTQFNYSLNTKTYKIEIGRFNIQLGQGLTINPINPFNFSSFLSPTSNSVALGADGVHIQLKKDPLFQLHIYYLGDRTYGPEPSEIHKSLIIRGDWHINSKTQMNYLLGEDHNRHFYGVETKTSFSKGLIFAQFVELSQELELKDNNDKGISHFLLGAAYDLSHNWSSRIEHGNIDKTPNSQPSNSYLPINKLLGWLNTIKFNEQWHTKFSFITDLNSQAQFHKISVSYLYGQGYNGSIYASRLSNKPIDDAKYQEQQLHPDIIGLNITWKF